jgi:hypothetical protein
MSKLRYTLACFSLTLLLGSHWIAAAAVSSDTPQYKCYVLPSDGPAEIIRFYNTERLPERFTDDATIARAQIPDSERQRIEVIIECVRQDLGFHAPGARGIEREQPQ